MKWYQKVPKSTQKYKKVVNSGLKYQNVPVIGQ